MMEPCEIEGLPHQEVQANGYLVAFCPSTFVVTHVSATVADLGRGDCQDWLGFSLETLLPPDLVHACRNAAGHSTIIYHREYVGVVCFEDKGFHGFLHQSEQRLLLELQRELQSARLGIESVFLSWKLYLGSCCG